MLCLQSTDGGGKAQSPLAKEAVPGKINEVGLSNIFPHPRGLPSFLVFAPYCLKSSGTLEMSLSACHFTVSLCRRTPFAAGP